MSEVALQERYARGDCTLIGGDCKGARCGILQTCSVYGLYDARIDDIFYVGSTIHPARRYSDHMHASSPCNFREAWIMAIIADGSWPIGFVLHEFTTPCEGAKKTIENAIAEELRAMGHTALCDESTVFPLNRAHDADAYQVGSPWRWDCIENTIAEHLDLVNEQARIVRWLREI